MQQTREILKIVVVGHVDHGKSTVIGRLLHDTNSLPEGAIEKVKKISREKGKPFEFAYLLDAFEEERNQGITIDTTQLQFHTENRDYLIIDAPGHKEFLKNMVSGAANAEAALLIIDAQEGIQEQSKRHGYILSLLGIQKVYVLINKMDLVGYEESRYQQIQLEMNRFLNSLNVYPLKYIPISAFFGENITSRSSNMSWYQGEPVLEAIDQFVKDQPPEEQPLRFPIQDVYKFDNRRIIAGRIETGSLKVGDQIMISPGRKTTRVKTIEYWQESEQRAVVSAGMSVGITVEDEFFNQRGEVISHITASPLIGHAFRANVFWLGKRDLVKGRKYKLKLATQELECELLTINKVIDATTLLANSDSEVIKLNDVAEVVLKTRDNISFDEFRNNASLGRFVIVDGYDVAGGGIISGIDQSTDIKTRFIDGDLELVADCFNEYYYELPADKLVKVVQHQHHYKIGDKVPINADTYNYPEDFDLINLGIGLIASIRGARLDCVTPIDNYQYQDLPMLNEHGFRVKVYSHSDYVDLRNEYILLNKDNNCRISFLNRWLDIMAYRQIKFQPSLNTEYSI